MIFCCEVIYSLNDVKILENEFNLQSIKTTENRSVKFKTLRFSVIFLLNFVRVKPALKCTSIDMKRQEFVGLFAMVCKRFFNVGLFRLQYRPFRTLIWPILGCKKADIATQ